MEFKILEWLDGYDNRALEERDTICNLQIYVDGINICEIVDNEDNKNYECITTAAVRLAEGIATNWDEIFSGETFNLRYQRMGYLTPNLEFTKIGDYLEVKSESHTYGNEQIVFHRKAYELMSIDNAKIQLANFVQEVLMRLDQSENKADDSFSTDLNYTWNLLIQPMICDS